MLHLSVQLLNGTCELITISVIGDGKTFGIFAKRLYNRTQVFVLNTLRLTFFCQKNMVP